MATCFHAGTDVRIGAPQEFDTHDVKAASVLFLPRLPGVRFYPFSCSDQEDFEDDDLIDEITGHGNF